MSEERISAAERAIVLVDQSLTPAEKQTKLERAERRLAGDLDIERQQLRAIDYALDRVLGGGVL